MKRTLKKSWLFAEEREDRNNTQGCRDITCRPVVSSGIIVDISRYMKDITEINEKEMWVRVQPGVVLDELNIKLRDKGLFFGPETSTSSRCNIGGMVGNNACGSHSVIYGSTRDHTIELKALLSDGSEAIFGPLDKEAFERKCQLDNSKGISTETSGNCLTSLSTGRISLKDIQILRSEAQHRLCS